MPRQGIDLIIPSVLVCGLLLEIRTGLNNNDTLLNWYEAHHYCQSLKLSLVDPYVDKISMSGTFWTNRHLGNYSSWIYLKGCVRNSSSSFNGRPVSSIWQCDNLCKLSRFFGIQNSSCICLNADDRKVKIAVKKSCTVECSTHNLVMKSSLKYCGMSGFLTVYGKVKVDVLNPTKGSCIALTCSSGMARFNPYTCDQNHNCACGDGENNTLYNKTQGNWTDCVQFCNNNPEKFISTITHCKEIKTNSFNQPAWIGVARNPNVDTGLNTTDCPLCYSCVNTSLECQYESCLQKYLPLCQQQVDNAIDTKDEITHRIYSTTGNTGSFNLTDRNNSTNETTMHDIFHGTTSLNKVMTTSSKESHNTESQDNSLETIIPVTVSCVSVLIVCAVVLIVYRYKRRKAFTSNRQEMVHFQNEYAEAFRTNMAARSEFSNHSINEKHKESSFKQSQMDVYDHLGENHERNFNEESENEYSHCGPRDTQYGEVRQTPSSNTYDHAKCTNVNDSEYSTCSR